MFLRCLYMNVDASCASKRKHEHVFLCVCMHYVCVRGGGEGVGERVRNIPEQQAAYTLMFLSTINFNIVSI